MDNELTRIQRYTCEKIKYYRRIHKYSQADMAERLWMSKRAYFRLENGETALTLDRLYQISTIFGISVHQLIGIESSLKIEEVIRDFDSMNRQFLEHEKKILELLTELKGRIS